MKHRSVLIKCLTTSLVLVLGTSLSSCGEDSHWKISEDTWSKMNTSITSSIVENTDGKHFNIDVSLDGDTFNKKATKDSNFLFLDIDKLRENYSLDADYVSYDLLKEYSLVYDSVSLNDDNTFSMTLSTYPRNDAAILFHKDCTNSNDYYLVNVDVTPRLGAYESPAYEDYYPETKYNYAQNAKLITGLITGAALICCGFYTATETPAVTGFCTLLSCITGRSMSSYSGASNQDILNQIYSLQTKMNSLSNRINENHNQVMSETIATQDLVYKELLTTVETSINNFNDSFISAYNKYQDKLSSYIKGKYQDFVKSSQTISLKLYKDKETGKLAPIYHLDEKYRTTDTTYSFTVSDFSTAKEFLTKHNGIATDGFADAFNKDILNTIKETTLPTGLNSDDVITYVDSTLDEEFTKDYYTEHTEKADELISLIKDMSQHIYGANSCYNFISLMYNRLQYMYNFAGEAKESFNLMAAYYMSLLDQMVAQAQMAGIYTKTDYYSILDDAQKARDAIQQLNYEVQNMDDNYSFLLNKKLTGSFYKSVVGDEKNGKNLTMTHSYYHYTKFYGEPGAALTNYEYEEISESDFDSIDKISSTDLVKIATRMNSLKNSGLVDQSTDFIHYLNQNKVIDDDALDTYLHFYSFKGINVCRILTSVTTKKLDDEDGGLKLTVMDRNVKSSDTFSLGENTTYLKKEDKEFWSGKKYIGEWVDGITGEAQTSGVLDAYARCDESHWYWFNDVTWALTFRTPSTAFFVVSYVK